LVTSFDDLFVYEACVREVLGRVNKWPGKARILNKGIAWSRDTWLTNSMWCEKDFVLHGWQRRLISSFLGLNWNYKDTFIRTEKEIETIIDGIIAETAISYKNALDRINNFL
uniref:Uncharacterized protein n=1 Tax=Parascaris equorum TaxID=6256 RepID=A0A914RCG6_PAREQ